MGRAREKIRALLYAALTAGAVLACGGGAVAQSTVTTPLVVKANAPVVSPPVVSPPAAPQAVVSSTVGPTTKPAVVAPVAVSALERTPIVRPAPAATGGVGTNSATPPIATNPFDLTRVLLALSLIVVIVLLLRWAARLMFPGTVASRAGRVVHVLSRSVLSPKQQVVVLQVGQRLLVVGDCGTQMNTLCEITDPEEVAGLIGQLNQEKRDPISTGFASLFRRAGQQYPAENAAADDSLASENQPQATVGATDDDEQNLVATKQDVDGLMDRIRGLSKQFGRS